jgi:YegS/Rv2252/BmrU family lipid kinase
VARALLIVNPVAARTNSRTPGRIAQALRLAGWQVDVVTTGAPGDAREFARQAVVAGVDTVAVFGGDGTTMQAAASLIGTEVALGLIPGGTGNLLAGNLRIPGNPMQAVRVLIGGRRRIIDVGRMEEDGGSHYFGVTCGAGADAWVMGQTPTHHKRRWGIGAYLATAARILPRLRNTDCTVTVDGEVLSLSAVLLLILNCGEMIPPLVRVRPEVSPEDGLLDFVAVSADSPWQGMRGLLRAIREGYRKEHPDVPYIRYARGRQFRVESREPLPTQFDGDPVGTTPFSAEVVPHALTVLTN